MSDCFDSKKRSSVMSRIKAKNTKPERVVRSLLHSLGYRFRLHKNSLPGSPDIVLTKYKTVIFVHGCFWHQHEGCSRASLPKTNVDYWIPKLERNKRRFEESKKALEDTGWIVCIIWECETKDIEKLTLKVRGCLSKGTDCDL